MSLEVDFGSEEQLTSGAHGSQHNRRTTLIFTAISLAFIVAPAVFLVAGRSTGRYLMHPVALLAFASVGFGWLVTALSTSFFDFHDAEVVLPLEGSVPAQNTATKTRPL